MLEERDEYDQEEKAAVIKINKDHYVADGRVSISDLAKLSGIHLPTHDAYETLGGFIIDYFGKIPKKNSLVREQEWIFRVIEVEEKRVVKIDISRASEQKIDE